MAKSFGLNVCHFHIRLLQFSALVHVEKPDNNTFVMSYICKISSIILFKHSHRGKIFHNLES